MFSNLRIGRKLLIAFAAIITAFAASLEQTAAALAEIATAIRKTAQSTERSDADLSGSVVQDAVSAMKEIERSAHQISHIIGVIDEVAFQTNLLALNAGVEAARAGDAGQGFAVVASEVRPLARRSAEAAKEIKALISSSTTLVGRGDGLVDETGQALTRIIGRVEELNGIVTSIAASAHEQVTGLAKVNTTISQMDQVTQQNAAMVEETTAASHPLAREADELARLTSRFRTDYDAPLASVAEQSEPARARQQHPARRKPDASHAIHGATALAARPAAEHDGWEEF